MTKQELGKAIYDICHLTHNPNHPTGKFQLRSGILSDEYFDKYLFEAEPTLLEQICDHIYFEMMDDLEVDMLAGLETGGIPIAVLIARKTLYKVLFVRKQAKDYGTCKCIEGPAFNGKKVLVCEDVVTTGGQIIKSVQELRKNGAIVEHVICVIDREQGGKENLAKEGLTLLPLFTMSELKEYAKS